MALSLTPEQLRELAKRHHDRHLRNQHKTDGLKQEPTDVPTISEDSKAIILALLTKLHDVCVSKASRCEAAVIYWRMRCAAPWQIFRAANADSLATAEAELSKALANEEASRKALDEFEALHGENG